MDSKVSKLLLSWYDEHARDLPWRGIHDPYKTWLSETMLQQTRVETVKGYYDRFLNRFPDVETLASSTIDDVLKQWEGLGYYSRARNLHKGAQQIMEQFNGVIPSTRDELLTVCGIGPYTAGAIASIAFCQPVPAVDGNVIRVVSRLCGIRDNVGVPSVRRMLEQRAGDIMPDYRPGDFNQALMDLGSSVCVPGTPDCVNCPLRSVCDAYDAGDAEDLPVMPRKNPPRTVYYDVLLIKRNDYVLMRKRTESLLKGMWVYPMLEDWNNEQDIIRLAEKETGLTLDGLQLCCEAKHVFTHRVWQMRIYTAFADGTDVINDAYRFVRLDEMRALPIPTAVRAAREAADKLLLGMNATE